MTGSTNADLLLRTASAAPEGLWLRADAQDSGKGRMERSWISPSGNLYASTIVRLQPSDPPAPTLAFVIAVAVHMALEKLVPQVAIQIKWPNDLLAGNGQKLCGMLLERQNDAVVIGIGVNLVHSPDGLDRPVTSIADLGAVPPPPQVLAEMVAHFFADRLNIWRMHGPAAVFADWQTRAHPIGTILSVNLPDGEHLSGRYHGLSTGGALMLHLANGSIRAIHAADVFLV